ncbi:MAG TPA: NAD(P)/FAD-dependent oxidoreductase [Candidatus Dormibacteraeota bacterium]|nr:NAD(P)/FAD-dependent oxidoreductase [Candidatus Dormibacteraeota bacterium]
MSAPSDVDVVVIGAGHNGLAATALLAARGLRVVCLEKNAYVGGMAGTREILSGCRNDVGASLLFPLAKGLEAELELARYGVEFIDLPIMASNLSSQHSPPAIFYANPLRMAGYVLRHFGVRAMIGFVRLMAFCQYPASLMDRFTPRSVPPTLDELLARAPSARKRRQIELAFTGSAMDLIDRFLPDVERHRTLRALAAFAAVQSTYKGPFTPGSALCLVYTFAQNEGGGLMRRVKGGMGSLSEALCRSIADKGGEVRLKSPVQRVLIEGERAAGVELRDGSRIRARAVLSSLDKPATFFVLVGREHLGDDFIAQVERIEHRGAYMHLLFKLRRLPRFGPPFEHLNADPRTRFNTTLVPDPELQQASYEACARGELPEHPPIGMQIPTVMDPTLAPDGFHIATTYGFFFPCAAPKAERGRLRDAMAERILDRLSEFLPDLRDCIVERAVFSSDHFATMQGATNGDLTHGLIHPEQMIGGRLAVPGSAHATPIPDLYLCGASCHPGPGVTFLPGYGAAYEVAEALRLAPASRLRGAA